jgi:hypothetical protein
MNYQLKQHPLSAVFPAMSDEDFQDLRDSIATNGVLNPITIYEGMVLDGWHRYTASVQINMACPQARLEDWIDPKDFVLAQNKVRRHITQSQLALATAAVYKWYPNGSNQHKTASVLKAEHQKSTKELAEIAGVGVKTIERAKSVLAEATPEVQEAVKAGKIGLVKAAAIAKLPQEQQAAAIAKPLPKPELKVVPVVAQEDEYTPLDEAHDKIAELQDALAIASVGSNDSEEAQQAAGLIAELRKENKRLEIALKAVTASRDGYQNQVADLQQQINRQRREIDRATGTRTA